MKLFLVKPTSQSTIALKPVQQPTQALRDGNLATAYIGTSAMQGDFFDCIFLNLLLRTYYFDLIMLIRALNFLLCLSCSMITL